MEEKEFLANQFIRVVNNAYNSENGSATVVFMMREQNEGESVLVTVNAHIVKPELVRLLLLNEALREFMHSEETQTPKTTQ